MTARTALLWKEWHDGRPYLLIGLGLFLGLPLVGMAESAVMHPTSRNELLATGWVIGLGGVLAVFTGVGMTTPDRRPKLEDFWRSRPIRVGPWLAGKFAVGLAIVLVCGVLPPVVECVVNRSWDETAMTVLTYFPFFWAAIYGLAFLAGSLVARPSHAATLALAAMLLVYVAPVVVPPLGWLNVADVDGQGGRRQVAFAVTMTAISAAAGAVGIVGVARGWRVVSGRRTMYGLVAAALLLLFASAAFQLGSNLPIVAQVDVPDDEWIRRITPGRTPGTYEVVVAPDSVYDVYRHEWHTVPAIFRRLTVGPGGLTLGPGVIRGPSTGVADDADDARRVIYDLDFHDVAGKPDRAAVLRWGVRPTNVYAEWPHRRELFTQPKSFVPQNGINQFGWTHRAGDRLYVVSTRLMVFDVGRPGGEPVLVSDEPYPAYGTDPAVATDTGLTVRLLPLPGLSADERFDLTMRWQGTHAGPYLVQYPYRQYDRLDGYRLVGRDEATARYDYLGRYQPTALQRLTAAGGVGLGSRTIVGDRLYLNGLGDRRSGLNGGVTVLDLGGPRPMRVIGHFAAPGAAMTVPLPDERQLVASAHRVWLVGGPR